MVSRVRSLGLTGIDGYEVTVECDLSGGLPAFDVVGLPDAAVKESRERVRSAIKNCGYGFPARRITINLAPADTKKIGSVYDLPILLSILHAQGALDDVPDDAVFVGEVALDGTLRPCNGALPMASAAMALGYRAVYCPADNAQEASLAGDITVYPVGHVVELLAHLEGKKPLTPVDPISHVMSAVSSLGPDFADVMGQENAKRAIEIAAAGSHNILMIGPPGAGKSMLASRIPGILPDMTKKEALDATKIHSVAGLTSKSEPILTSRPYRAPHHTISAVALSGGGSIPRPGEISLAHNGVLFLDEFPEFDTDALEILRQPLENGQVTISRVSGTITYPSRFMLVCAMNPCKCGWYGHPSGRCTCSPKAVEHYQRKISGPLLDRIDLHIEVPPVKYDALRTREPAESSAVIKQRVEAARAIQRKRFEGTGVTSNAYIPASMLRESCRLENDAQRFMETSFSRMGLTARSHDRILRVARTIADLAGCDTISVEHLAESFQYRCLDRSGRF